MMAGVLFIINVPRQKYEHELRRRETSPKVEIESDKNGKTVDDRKEGRRKTSKSSNISSFTHDDDTVTLSKCNISTDCLQANVNENGLFKSYSENVLSENIDMSSERKSYLKSSWEDVKQTMKPKKNKLKITEPEKVNVLDTFKWDTTLETILSEVICRLNIRNAAWSSTNDDNSWQVQFSLESSHLCEELLQVLRTFGIGSRYQSSVSVIPCALYYKSDRNALVDASAGYQSDANSAWSRFSSSMRARNNLAQILHNVRAEAALTFDWLFLLIVAAFVAAIGLVENSTVILVASMLISPLMGPITAGTLGTAVRDRSLQQMGVMHELLGLFLSLVIGFIFGLTICAVDERYGVGDWPTYEMMSRCEIRSLWVGVLVAIPSGAGVALAVLGENTASLVGVAISASLLPPAVNAGLLWAMALVHLVFMDDDTRWTSVVKTTFYSTNQPTELAVLGSVSLCLTLVNIVCIFLAGVVVYKVKKVCPFERRDFSWWKSSNSHCKSFQYDEQNGGSFSPWDIYSKWCNESDVKQDVKDAEKKSLERVKEIIQSDTVTFRRPQPLTDRLRAHNFEDFCDKRVQGRDDYMPMDINDAINKDQNKYRIKDDDDLGNFNNIEMKNEKNSQKNITCSNNEKDKPKNGSNSIKFSFQNKGFEENIIRNNKDRPTIEPSSNYTIDNKKYGVVVLGNKSYDV